MKKIAVPLTINDEIDDHFGHCEFYAIYEISDDNKILGVNSIKSEKGCGCKSNIASILSNLGVKLMLAGGIGAGAINILNLNGIQVIRGCKGKAADIVMDYLNGKIKDSGESCEQHSVHNSNGGDHICQH